MAKLTENTPTSGVKKTLTCHCPIYCNYKYVSNRKYNSHGEVLLRLFVIVNIFATITHRLGSNRFHNRKAFRYVLF